MVVRPVDLLVSPLPPRLPWLLLLLLLHDVPRHPPPRRMPTVGGAKICPTAAARSLGAACGRLRRLQLLDQHHAFRCDRAGEGKTRYAKVLVDKICAAVAEDGKEAILETAVFNATAARSINKSQVLLLYTYVNII